MSSERIPFERKLVDTIEFPRYGKVELHWRKEVISNVFKGKRAKEETDSDFAFYDPHYLLGHFGLKAFEFGNWLSQEDRYVYLAGAAYAIQDYCRVLGIKPASFGLGKRISLAFGARGRARTLAHFEPTTFAINLTRYRDEFRGFNKYIAGNSGAGSLGHEYSHALDFYAGRYIDKGSNYNYASEILKDVYQYNGYHRETKLYRIQPAYRNGASNEVRQLIIDSVGKLMYKHVEDDTYIETEFYSTLQKEIAQKPGLGEYWTSIVEIWARSYEVFLFKKCEARGIEESYLKKKKYSGFLYPGEELFTPSIEKAFADFSKLVINTAK